MDKLTSDRTEYKSPGQVTSLYAADEYRSSDHDPVFVDLELGLERIYLPVVMRGYPQPWTGDRCLGVG